MTILAQGRLKLGPRPGFFSDARAGQAGHRHRQRSRSTGNARNRRARRARRRCALVARGDERFESRCWRWPTSAVPASVAPRCTGIESSRLARESRATLRAERSGYRAPETRPDKRAAPDPRAGRHRCRLIHQHARRAGWLGRTLRPGAAAAADRRLRVVHREHGFDRDLDLAAGDRAATSAPNPSRSNSRSPPTCCRWRCSSRSAAGSRIVSARAEPSPARSSCSCSVRSRAPRVFAGDAGRRAVPARHGAAR